MPINNTKQEINEVFQYIDAHNEIGVTSDELFEVGLFARRSDAASWLSRWKGKGALRTERDKGERGYSDSGKKRYCLRYFTVVDGSGNDWSNKVGLSQSSIV